MRIEATTKQAYDLMHEGALALSRAEQAGIRVDVDYYKKAEKECAALVQENDNLLFKSDLGKAWKKLYGAKASPTSDTQLRKILYKHFKLKAPSTTENDSESADEAALTQLKSQVEGLEYLLQRRKFFKLGNTFVRSILNEQVEGWMHPFFHLHTTTTFRSSSSEPNFQNQPKRDKQAAQIIRSGLFPRIGHQLYESDFSGLEVNIAACYHEDPVMIGYLNNPESDMHGDETADCFMLDDYNKDDYDYFRKAIKNGFIFPQFYGDYYVNNAISLCDWLKLPKSGNFSKKGVDMPDGTPIGSHLAKKGVKNFESFCKHLKKREQYFWETRFKVYTKWKKQHYARYQKKGYVDMFTGFRCHGPMKKNQCINYPVQGAAFHCLLWSFIQIDKVIQSRGWDSRLIGQIHDAIIADVKPSEFNHFHKLVKLITSKRLAQNWKWIIVPLQIETEIAPVDKPWQDMKKVGH